MTPPDVSLIFLCRLALGTNTTSRPGSGVGVCGEVGHAGAGGGAVPVAYAGGDEDVHAAVAVVVAVGAGGEGDDVGLREVVDGVVRDDVVAVGRGVNFFVS